MKVAKTRPSRDSSTDWYGHTRLTSSPRRSTDRRPLVLPGPVLVREPLQLLPTTRTSPCRESSTSGRLTWAGPSGCRQRVDRTGPAFVNGHDDLKTKPGKIGN